MEVRFEILGEPMGKQRPKSTSINGFVRNYTPAKTVNYETLVKQVYQQTSGHWFGKEPLKGEINIYYKLEKKHYGKKGINKEGQDKLNGLIRPIKTPDFDNCEKIIYDALNGIAYDDDKQIVDNHTKKFYAEQPRVEVYITDEV